MSQLPRISSEGRAKLSSFANRVRRTVSSHENSMALSEMDNERPIASGNAGMTTDDLLTCSICLERYQDSETSGKQPKILPCFHTFCRRCLEQMVIQQKSPTAAGPSRNMQNNPIRAIISCPQCRRLIAIPNGGPSAFQTNFYVLQMNDLMKEVGKGSATSLTLPEESVENGNAVQAGSSSPTALAADENCNKHGKWPLLFYCKKCSQRICSNCTVLDHKESDGHVIVDLQVVLDESLKEIYQRIGWADRVVQSSKHLIQNGQAELNHLNIAEDSVCASLNKIGETVAKALAMRLRKMQEQVRNEMISRSQAIRDETCTLIDLTKTLDKKRREISDIANSRSPSWILDGKAQRDLEDLDIMAKKLEGAKLEPRYFLLFNENMLNEAEMQVLCERLIPAPQRRLLPAKIELQMYKAVAGQFSHVTTILKDAEGKELTAEEYPLNLNLIDPEGEIIDRTITTYKSEGGNYTTSFLASQCGDYGAEAELNGFPLDCREIKLVAEANEPIAVVGERGAEEGKFNKPVSVVVSAEDEALLVAEFENQRIQIFNPNTFAFKSSFSVAGETGKCYPGSIAIFNVGSYREVVCPKVTIMDEGRLSADTIQIFDLNTGQLVNSFQNKVLRKSLHVTVNSCGRIIASDRDANSLFVFNREGALLGRIGRHGSGPGQFNCPVFVACGLNDDILVADSANNRVQILDKTGIFKTEIGVTGRGKLGAPAGITVDRFGNILVADSQNNRVQMYTKDGQYLASLQPQENAFSRPRGVATWASDGAKRLFVIDRGNHSVKTLSYM